MRPDLLWNVLWGFLGLLLVVEDGKRSSVDPTSLISPLEVCKSMRKKMKGGLFT